MQAHATWKMGSGFFNKADANKCAKEIESLGEKVTPQQIVDYARDENTELHKVYEWDDSIAAEKYRIYQTRIVIANLVFEEPKKTSNGEKASFQIYYNVEKGSNTYEHVKRIVCNEDSYEKLLLKARAELQSFKKKYHMISELREILDLID